MPDEATYMLAGQLDDDLGRLVISGETTLALALALQQVRELRSLREELAGLREDVQHAARQAWLDGGEGRSG